MMAVDLRDMRDFEVLTIVGGAYDGLRADRLRLTPLYRELKRMNIPGIESTMTKSELLGAFHSAVAEVANTKIRPPNIRTVPLDVIVAKQAAALIAKQAAGGSDQAPTSSAPAFPIASTRV